MKRVLSAVFILAFAILLSTLSFGFVEKRLNTLEESLDALYVSLTEENIASAEEKLDKIDIYWNKNKIAIGFFISGEACNSFDDELSELRIFLSNKNPDCAMVSLNKCFGIISSIREKERLSLSSVM